MSEKIAAALRQLDPTNDNHWTGDGLPRLETVRLLLGDSSLSRETVTHAAPGFTRHSATQAPSGPASTPEPAGQGGSTSTGAGAAPQAPNEGTGEGAGDGADHSGAGAGADSEVGAGSETGQGGTSEADQELARAQRTLDVALAAQVAANKAVKDATTEVDRLLVARDVGSTKFPTAITDYLRSQQRQRDERAAANAQLKKSGFAEFVAALPKGSALDAAFKRKNTRGTARPAVPRK